MVPAMSAIEAGKDEPGENATSKERGSPREPKGRAQEL